MKHSDVTISILTHTALDECRRCLSAVLNSREGAKLILTANGNAEAAEYFEKLAMQHENIEVIVNIQNLGFIGPNNEAFRRCETRYFVMLNDDAIPPPEWLDKMKDALAHPDAVISGPSERWLSGDFVGRSWRGGTSMEPEFIEGSCLMLKSSLVRPYGLFAPDLAWAYCEDADLCLRMRQIGLTIHKADFILEHRAGTTSREVPHLHDAMRQNFVVCKNRWARYLQTRRFP